MLALDGNPTLQGPLPVSYRNYAGTHLATVDH